MVKNASGRVVTPCFTPGTAIATPKGERPVESLGPGDAVITRDNGIDHILWTGARRLDHRMLARAPYLKPVLIRRGALGPDRPERDMLVSPNHRMLAGPDQTLLPLARDEAFVAAKHLIDHRAIRRAEVLGVTYVHFACARHQVVLANGAWSESFLPTARVLCGMGNAQRLELGELFANCGRPGAAEAAPAARRTLAARELRKSR